MRKVNLGGHNYHIAPPLDSFTIIEVLNSKNVFCAAISEKENKFYVKFLNGAEYIYNDVPMEILQHAFTVDSMGSYVSKYLRDKFTFDKQVLPLMILATSTEVNSSPEPAIDSERKRKIFFPEIEPFEEPVLKGSPQVGPEFGEYKGSPKGGY